MSSLLWLDKLVLGWCDSREEFEFTLDLQLDGLERKRSAELAVTHSRVT